MAAVEANPIHLYTTQQPGGTHVGIVSIESIERPRSSSDRALRLRFRYQPSTAEPHADSLLYSEIDISSTSDRRLFGRVISEASAGSTGLLGGERELSGTWLWYVTPDDLEAIERERAAHGESAVVLFNVAVAAVALAGDAAFGFAGDSQFRLPQSEWVDLLQALGYTVPPSVATIASAAITGSDSWRTAVADLTKARRLLALGEDRAALQVAYHHFDALVRNPYRKLVWEEALSNSDLPKENVEIIAEMLAAHAQMLNKLARHPSDEIEGSGGRAVLPMEHWEAELLSVASHLLLSAARRWFPTNER